MKTKLIIALCILIAMLIATGSRLFAQTNTGQITGKVADSITRKTADYITVNLKLANAPVKALVTNTNGTFAFIGLKPAMYTVTFSAIGYQPKNITVDITNGPQSHDLGSILLQTQNKQLKEVSIAADKPIIKQEVDRISYDLQADPASKSSSLLDMMRKVPFVTLDANENILLKGDNNFKIFINGKPSGMIERDPKNIMRSIPASTIQRIEVITIPPSKYDAEGLAGIINIITNKKIAEGYNGTLNLNTRVPGGPGLGTSFTVKDGKFGISGFGGGNMSHSPTTTDTRNRITTGIVPTSLAQQNSSSSDNKSGYFGTEMSYEIDSLNLVSAQFNISGNKNNGKGNQLSALNGIAAIEEAYKLTNASNSKNYGLDVSVNYQLGFKKNKSKLLTFSYRYNDNTNNSNNNLVITDRVNYTDPDYNQHNNTGSSEQTAQVDYVQGLKKWNIEAGAKGIFRNYDSDFKYEVFNATSNVFEPDYDLSSNFNGDQNILAAYNSWQYIGSKNWGLKAGLRAEHTTTNGYFVSNSSTVHQDYLNIIPAFAFNYNFKNRTGINIGFTQRLKRPNINKLNPFIDRSNPDFISGGNPDLKAVILNSIQVGYRISKKASINMNASYEFADGADMPVAFYDPVTKVTYTTFQNSAKVARLLGFININYPITPKWNFIINSTCMYFWLSAPINGIQQSNNLYSLNFATSTNYAFDKGWRVTAEFAVSGHQPTGVQGSANGFSSTSFSVNKQVIKNKLSFSASVQNPFTQYRINNVKTSGNGFIQTAFNQYNFRSASFNLNYNFGKLKDGVKKTKRGINNDDK